MATTPLKTASRALSIATVMVAGFSAWLLITQGDSPHAGTTAPPNTGRSVEFAAVSDSAPADRTHEVIAEKPSRRRLDEGLAARPKSKPQIDDDSFFEDETPEPNRLANSAKRTRPSSTSTNSQPRIQPELGRVSGREPLIIAPDAFEELGLAAEEVTRPPQRPRSNSRPTADFPPVQSLPTPESSRVESQLTALQKKIDQLAQAQTEQKSNDVQKAIETLQQIQENKQTEQFEKLLQQLKDSQQNATDPTKAAEQKPELPKLDGQKPEAASEGRDEKSTEEVSAGDKKAGAMRFQPSEGYGDRFDSIDFDDVDISQALAKLGELSGMNILVGRGISGRVPAASLQNVTAEEALDAITKSLGYVFEREGNFVYVWTATDSMARKQVARKTVSKVYRPRYVSVKDLQTLITPMLSKPGGLIAVTTPSEIGLEESKTKVGGNSLAQTDALLVVDFPEVIAQVDAVLTEIDVPPSQVVIEAMILSVKLTDTMKLGVNFALLSGDSKQLVTSGNGSQINGSVGFPGKDSIVPAMGDFIANTSGLKYGFLQGDLTGFVEALETLAETSVIASPSVRVLNKQKAELIIGSRLGYKTITNNGVQSIENINFLEVGTKLILRPFVSEDGLVRMEIHPERSDGIINGGGLPESRTTQVTSNVMIRDGSTIVVGGLIEEQANQKQDRVPGLGALPVVGNLFKNKTNDTIRTELIVLITPRVIRDPDAECEGDLSRSESERRHQNFRDKLSPINRHNLARVEYERAARYFDEGDAPRAKRHIDESLRHNRTDKDALRLRDQITAAIDDKNWFKKLRRKPPTEYHRVPSAPTSLPGEAIFEQEIPAPTPSPFTPVPPAPAVMPDEPMDSQPSAAQTRSKPNAVVKQSTASLR